MGFNSGFKGLTVVQKSADSLRVTCHDDAVNTCLFEQILSTADGSAIKEAISDIYAAISQAPLSTTKLLTNYNLIYCRKTLKMRGEFYIDELNSLQRPALKSTETCCRFTYRAEFQYFTYNTREEVKNKNPTRCHLLYYCTSYRLNMFRALLCPSSGARDYSVGLPHWVVSFLVCTCALACSQDITPA